MRFFFLDGVSPALNTPNTVVEQQLCSVNYQTHFLLKCDYKISGDSHGPRFFMRFRGQKD